MYGAVERLRFFVNLRRIRLLLILKVFRAVAQKRQCVADTKVEIGKREARN